MIRGEVGGVGPWRLGVGKAEHELAQSSDERLVNLAICTDQWAAESIIEELDGSDPPGIRHLAERIRVEPRLRHWLAHEREALARALSGDIGAAS